MSDPELWAKLILMSLLIAFVWWWVVIPTYVKVVSQPRTFRLLAIAHTVGIISIAIVLTMYFAVALAWGLDPVDWMLADTPALFISLVGSYLLFSLLTGIWVVGRLDGRVA